MCGRFALGANADQLAVDLHQQYFVPPPPRAPPPADSGATQRGAGTGSQSGKNAEHDENAAADAATKEHEVEWASSEAKGSFRPRYNVAPTTKVPVLRRSRQDPERYELDLLKWGLVPHWYSDPPAPGLSTINATCESVFQGTPAWRGPRQDKRCVVVAQGFYEWLDKGKEKQPYFVKRNDGKLMAFAGLWDHCDFKGKHEPVTSFTILTVPVNSQLKFLHTRMPAILSTPSEIELWLSGEPWSERLKTLIRPFQGDLEYYAVDRGVGKVQNDSEDFVKPLAQKKGSLDSLFAKQAAAAAGSSPAKPKPKLEAEALPRADSSRARSTDTDSKPKSEERDRKVEDAQAMNPDEDEDTNKLVELEKEAAGQEDRDPVPSTSGEHEASVDAGDRTGSSSEKGKRPAATPVKRKKLAQVEVLELSDDSSSGEDGPRAREEEDAVAEEEEPPRKRKKQGGARKDRTTTKQAKRAKPTEATSGKIVEDAEGTVKHTDGHGNEELTDFFKVEEKPST
ncbi:hypothetical protein JCM8115_000652 [Rhodotorula mucilaginosa]